jgi:hypothetical protein
LAKQLVDPERRPLRLHGAGVETRDVEQRRQDLLDRVEGGVDVLGEPGSPTSRSRSRRAVT